MQTSANSEIENTEPDLDEQQLARLLKRRRTLTRLRLAFAANPHSPQLRALIVRFLKSYDPDQPRVPAGQPDGGQWLGANHRDVRTRATHPPIPSRFRTERNFTGDQPWQSRTTGTDQNGQVLTTDMTFADGSKIDAHVDPSGNGPFDSQYTVTNPDGSRISFTNVGNQQTVTDARTGAVVSQTIVTSQGAEPIWPDGADHGTPPVVLAQAAPPVPVPQVEIPLIATSAALTLYSYLSSRSSTSSPSGPGLPPPLYVPGDPNAIPILQLDKALGFDRNETLKGTYTGTQTEAQVQSNCPAYQRIQQWTDEGVATLRNDGTAWSPQIFGTAVHAYVATQVRLSGDPTLKANPILGLGGTQVLLGAIIPDISETQPNGTTCIYDIKTGVSGLPDSRAANFVNRWIEQNRSASTRFIVVTVRPSR